MTSRQTTDIKASFIFAPGPIAGAEKVVLTGAKALVKAGVNLRIVVIEERRNPACARDFIEIAQELKIPYHVFTATGRFDLKLIKSLSKYLKGEKDDLIHVHGFKAGFYAHLGRPKNTRMVATQHGTISHGLILRFYEAIGHFVMRRCDKVVAVSSDTKRQLLEKGVKEDKIVVIENMLSIRPPETPRPGEGLPPIHNFLYIGRLGPEKGSLILLNAVARIKDKYPLTVTVLGSGPMEDEMIKQIEELGLEKVVRLQGFVKDVRPYLNRCHAVLMPSLREGLPMTLIEAASCGIPVIASNVGGIPTIVENQVNGRLVPPNDPKALAEAISKFIENDALYLENAGNMAKKVIDRFSPERWADKTISTYQSLPHD